MNQTPYAQLDPNLILEAIESVGLLCSGSLLALNSFENRVYQIGIEDAAPMIAKFYRPHRWSDETILEEHQFSCELTEHDIPIVSPWKNNTGETLHHYKEFRFALFPRWGGRAFELENKEQLEWMGRFLGRLHAVGASKKFHHRPTLGIDMYGLHPLDFLLKNNFIPDFLKEKFIRTAETVLEKIAEHFKHLSEINFIRLHGDLHAGNVLWNDAGPHIVDLDDCMTGPAIQDIWMLLSGDEFQRKIQLNHILNGYEEFHEFNPREIYLIESLRTLRMLHYSAWLAKRWEDPAFPLNFPWFNSANYWEEQLADLNDQLELLLQLQNSMMML